MSAETGSTGSAGSTGSTGSTEYWDAAAERFDDEPDHGLRNPGIRAAWDERLRSWLPGGASDVLDLGCGTGSLTLLAARQGHRVTAVDLSPRMVEQARRKLDGTGARVLEGDAAEPPVEAGQFDVVLVRHVLWTLRDPAEVLRHWARLLRPGGRMVLIEGRWGDISPVGIAADALAELAAPLAGHIRVEQLAHDPALWGKAVHDERYAAVVRFASV
ncbi:class I SAM-dependent methyltransferase [Streptomyces sp. H10-C2]|uniref:class I SAM-dependent methyltransferase n=1 Tax=unclassified Streptomyces TaxID=2593676 RepID=UPI0024B8ED39|nr:MULTISPECIES: class I SAM-dependent methyltransferase [unclassified Streptomyces]MDJ0343122.1 class I SAM-dependent methyltransferase [Streptomyces sp. PH10-H1]MDJ0371064.1 class I SAM-dependent methyltransferase [Streptomyces sp. H10-C2]